MAHAPGSRCRKFLSLNLQNFRFIVSCHLRKIEKMIYDVNFFKALYKLCLMKRVAKSSSRLDNSLLKMPLATNYQWSDGLLHFYFLYITKIKNILKQTITKNKNQFVQNFSMKSYNLFKTIESTPSNAQQFNFAVGNCYFHYTL